MQVEKSNLFDDQVSAEGTYETELHYFPGERH